MNRIFASAMAMVLVMAACAATLNQVYFKAVLPENESRSQILPFSTKFTTWSGSYVELGFVVQFAARSHATATGNRCSDTFDLVISISDYARPRLGLPKILTIDSAACLMNQLEDTVVLSLPPGQPENFTIRGGTSGELNLLVWNFDGVYVPQQIDTIGLVFRANFEGTSYDKEFNLLLVRSTVKLNLKEVDLLK